jgi:MFS family permease
MSSNDDQGIPEDRIPPAEKPTIPMREKLIFGISINVLLMGFVSLFTDVSSEMITAILPQFLLALGANVLMVTFVTGVTTAVANIIKGISGWLAEKLNRRKAFVVAGYALSNIVKPFIGAQTNWVGVLALKVTDRVGKGIRTSPRDTLISHYATIVQEQVGDSETHSGRNFGIHRSMDTMGAVIGPFLAFGLVYYFMNVSNVGEFLAYSQTIWWSIVPGIIAIVFILFVKEIKVDLRGQKKAGRRVDKWPRELTKLIATLAIMEFASIDVAFLIVRATQLFPEQYQALIVIVYAIFNVVYALLAPFIGRLEDKFSKQRIIVVGLSILLGISVLVALPYVQGDLAMWVMIIAFLLFGLYMAIVDTGSRAFVSDVTGKDKKGRAYSLYYLLVGIVSIPESILFGYLYDTYGATVAFLVEGSILLVCIIIFARANFDSLLRKKQGVEPTAPA